MNIPRYMRYGWRQTADRDSPMSEVAEAAPSMMAIALVELMKLGCDPATNRVDYSISRNSYDTYFAMTARVP